MSQAAIAQMYNTTPQNITMHIRNIYEDGELVEEATCKEFLQVQTEGTRQIKRNKKHYNFRMILAIGYRVRSNVGVHFRNWASGVLEEYTRKGFAMNDERLKNPKQFGEDYFDELLERIRDIRASEKRFYQKICEIYKTSIGKIAEGTVLTRKTVAAILQGISPIKFAMFKNNPEEFITKVIRLIKEQKATMIVEHISYDQIEGKYDSSIFTAEKHASFDKAYRAEKHIQDYVFTDGTAEKSVERRFAEELDGAKEVCVYAKLPKGFAIPTPVGSYSPDWAIAFYEGTVKHIYFIAETKGTMESLELRPIEKAKISCARKLFNEISTENVVYHDVDSYQSLLNIMNSIEKEAI